MRRPLGCLTASGILAAVLVLVAILAAAAATGNGLFSPGRLSGVAHGGPVGDVASHADLEARCDACHVAAWSGGGMADRCLACHTQVSQEIASGGGLHGRFATAATCRGCHTDHRGITASLTVADATAFPHDRTGYSLAAHPLRGGGGPFACLDCHPAAPAAYTPPSCLGCHQGRDASYMASHVTTFGEACLGCHDGVDTFGAAFAHATYPLVGGHESTACGACHVGATTLAALRATSAACVSCHAAKNVHSDRLGTACATCHTPAGWTDATVDHALTAFPLAGRHVDAACLGCHVRRQWTGIGVACGACHASVDPHAGQFPGKDCAACHSATGWNDVAFDHAQTGFRLVDGHAGPACAACHPNGRFAGTPTSCFGCHAGDDRHAGAFGKDCAACHRATTWSDWTFDHARSAFPLTGAHQDVACQKCHAGGVFTGTPTACASCHARPATHGPALGGKCNACHTTKAWLPATMNHNLTAFPLTGAHQSVACAKCHVGNVFRGTPTACSACHAKPASHGSFTGSSCATCHTTRAWQPASFNGPHPFPMSHGGAGGRCAACHPSSWTTYSCTRCHSSAAMADTHSGVAGYTTRSCVACHPTGGGGDGG